MIRSYTTRENANKFAYRIRKAGGKAKVRNCRKVTRDQWENYPKWEVEYKMGVI